MLHIPPGTAKRRTVTVISASGRRSPIVWEAPDQNDRTVMMHFKRPMLTALFAFLFACGSAAGASLRATYDQDKTIFVTPMVSGSARIPLFRTSSFWMPHPTAGFFILLPSTFEGLSLVMGIEGGVMRDRGRELKVQCLDIRCGVRCTGFIRAGRWLFAPEIGLSSLMAGAHEDGLIDISTLHVFGRVENEFGIYAGLAPEIDVKKMSFTFPVSIERIFSSPRRFTAVTFSCQLGYRFGK